MQSDEQLIRAYKDGDYESFRVLIDRYTTHIYHFVYKLGVRDEAADVTQEIFVKVWKNLKKFDHEKASFKTWLFTIVRNTAIDFLRKRKLIVFSELETRNEESFDETIPDEQLLPDEVLVQLEEKEFLEDTLTKLPLEHRTVLTLHYQEELTFDEIGRVLGKPLNTVKSWHRRAIEKLRKMLT